MRKYQDSDYAVNKFSPNIVYRFAEGTVEVTLQDYLHGNPGKTEQDFAELKALSDEIYHEQDLEDTRYGKRARTLKSVENSEQYATVSLDTELVHKQDSRQALKAAKQLLDSDELTEVQRRRFILYFFQGLSTRQIATLEAVHQNAVWKSTHAAVEKLKYFFSK